MAVIWQKKVAGKNYQVRAAGKTRRLYTNGVFHSQYNPDRQLTGSVWDLLSLPSFFLKSNSVRRILVLGVGGGAIIRQFRSWYPEAEIVGVELDKTHIQISKQFFGLKDKRVNLIEANAIDWLKSYRGLSFDIIVDDLFSERDDEPMRVVAADKIWLSHLTKCLTAQGILIMNFTEAKDFKANSVFHDRSLKKIYKQVYKFTTPLYDNNIAVMLQVPCKKNQWRKRILSTAKLATEYMQNQDKIKIRKII